MCKTLFHAVDPSTTAFPPAVQSGDEWDDDALQLDTLLDRVLFTWWLVTRTDSLPQVSGHPKGVDAIAWIHSWS